MESKTEKHGTNPLKRIARPLLLGTTLITCVPTDLQAAGMGPDLNGDGVEGLLTSNPRGILDSGGEAAFVGWVDIRLGRAGFGVTDTPEAGYQAEGIASRNAYGAVIAHGDFNGDSYDDIAIGIPTQDLDGADRLPVTCGPSENHPGRNHSQCRSRIWDRQTGEAGEPGK